MTTKSSLQSSQLGNLISKPTQLSSKNSNASQMLNGVSFNHRKAPLAPDKPRKALSDITNDYSSNEDFGEDLFSLRNKKKEQEKAQKSKNPSNMKTFFYIEDSDEEQQNIVLPQSNQISRRVSKPTVSHSKQSLFHSNAFSSENTTTFNPTYNVNQEEVDVSAYSESPEMLSSNFSDKKVLREFFIKLDELNQKNEELHKKISELKKENENCQDLLKQKEQLISTLKKEINNDSIVTRYQNEIQELSDKMSKLQEQLQNERTMKIRAEEKVDEQQHQIVSSNEKSVSAMSELENMKKLMRLLEEKYRQSELSLTAIKEKYNSDSDQTLKDKEEIFSLRREVSDMCESVLSEKQKVENLEKQVTQLQKHNAEYKILVSDLQNNEKDLKKIIQEMEQSNEMNKARNEKLKTQLTETMQSSEKTQQSFNQKITQLEKDLANRESLIAQQQVQLEETNKKLQEKDKEVIEYKKMFQNIEEELKSKQEIEKTLKEKRASLMKKLEKEIKGHKASQDRIKDSESKIESLTHRSQELEIQLISKEKKIELHTQRISSLESDLEKEKIKGDRTWSELENTMNLLKLSNDEKEKMRTEMQVEQELKFKDYENKLKMMENKCSYYERLNQLIVSKKPDDSFNQQNMKKLHQDLIDLIKETETLTQSLSEKDSFIDQLKSEFEENLEKLRQTEDLLYESNQKHVKVGKSTKNIPRDESEQKLLIMEQCIDEILLEICLKGVNPSRMTIREKLVSIVNQIQNMREKSKSTQKALIISQMQCKKLEHIREFLERRLNDTNSTETSNSDLVQLNSIFENMEALTEERNQLQEQLDQVLAQQGNNSPYLSEKSSGTVINLLNNISGLLRDHESLLMTSERIDEKLMKQFNTIHFRFKDLIYQLESTPFSDMSSSGLQNSSKQMSLILQDEKITKLKYKIVTLEEQIRDYQRSVEEKSERITILERIEEKSSDNEKMILSLKEQLDTYEDRITKLTRMNSEYKDIISQFTQLHEQQRNQENLKKQSLSKQELSASRKSLPRPHSYAGLHLKQSRS